MKWGRHRPGVCVQASGARPHLEPDPLTGKCGLDPLGG
jgi:hypothetical protein